MTKTQSLVRVPPVGEGVGDGVGDGDGESVGDGVGVGEEPAPSVTVSPTAGHGWVWLSAFCPRTFLRMA